MIAGWYAVVRLHDGRTFPLAGPYLDRAGATLAVEAGRQALNRPASTATATEQAEVGFATFGVARVERCAARGRFNAEVGARPFFGRYVR